VLAWAEATTPRARVVWLGLFCWVVTVLLPSIHRASSLRADAAALLGLAPLVLAAGLWLSRSHAGAAAYMLLGAFPTAIALSMSRFEHELALATYTPASLVFALASLAGYAASASQLSAAHEQRRQVDHKPLGEVPPVDPELRRQQVGALALGSVTVGAILVLTVSSWQPPSAYREYWGRAAPQGAVLTALVAGLLGCAVIALVAPGLRAERKSKTKTKTKRHGGKARLGRTLRSLLLALGLGALYVLARVSR
jgi:hypothetical protein